MRGRRAPVGTEGIAQIVFEVLYHFRYTLCDLSSLLIDLRRVVAVLRAGAQIRAQLLIALKAAAAGVDQLLCVLRTLLHQMVDRHKRIRHNGQAVDQAAASVIFGSLLCGVADVHCRFQSALKAAQKRDGQQRDGLGRAVCSVAHLLRKVLQIFIEDRPDVAEQIFRVIVLLRADLFAGQRRNAAAERQLQHLSHVEPAVCRIGIVLAHDERLLAARHGVVGQILLVHTVLTQRLKQRVVVEERRRQAARRKEESSKLLIKPLRRPAIRQRAATTPPRRSVTHPCSSGSASP